MKLATQRKIFQGLEPTEWIPVLIQQLKRVSNPISRVVDFWVDNILEGYINEFVVDTITSYSEAKINFVHGPQGRYLTSLKTWINMLVCEKGILRMESDS